MKFADSHCHLTDRAFSADRALVLEDAREAGVSRIVTIASDSDDSLAALELACEDGALWCSAGIHPHSVDGSLPDTGLPVVRDIASHRRCVAIGETGLDYFYDNAPRDAQRRSFEQHARLAAELELPLVVHSRDAEADTRAVILESTGQVKGVLHCFTGSGDLMAVALEAGWFVSFTGIVTFKHFDADLVRDVPARRYMIETDSPYLAPVPKRGRRNEPAYVVHVARAVADIRGESLEQVARDTWVNTARFFGLPEDESRRAEGPAHGGGGEKRGPRP
ncbi:MAG: TatD family hydrolase [Gemmatimonadetes bacterium]|nr:TatD family hydrolase [Gemmatimonadota bacterium]